MKTKQLSWVLTPKLQVLVLQLLVLVQLYLALLRVRRAFSTPVQLRTVGLACHHLRCLELLTRFVGTLLFGAPNPVQHQVQHLSGL